MQALEHPTQKGKQLTIFQKKVKKKKKIKSEFAVQSITCKAHTHTHTHSHKNHAFQITLVWQLVTNSDVNPLK